MNLFHHASNTCTHTSVQLPGSFMLSHACISAEISFHTSHANCVSYVCMYVFVPAAQQLHVTCTPQLPSSSMYVCMYVSMHTPAAQQLSWYMHCMHTPAAEQLHACFDVHSSCPAAPILHDTSAAKTASCLHILVHVFQLPSSFLACHMEAFMPARAYNPAAM